MGANRANMSYHIKNQIRDNDGIIAGKILERRVRVSSAEILALATTPKELVPAPGTDKILEFISATIKHNAGTAYAEPDPADDCYIRYSGGQQCSADIDSTNFLDQTDDEIRIIPFNVAAMAITVDLEALKNTALQLHNPDSNLITGTGTLDIRISYRIHDFS